MSDWSSSLDSLRLGKPLEAALAFERDATAGDEPLFLDVRSAQFQAASIGELEVFYMVVAFAAAFGDCRVLWRYGTGTAISGTQQVLF